MRLIGNYINGNYKVKIFDDGTKIRETEANEFKAKFPECMDVKITNYCDMNCPMCHEGSTTEGKHGDLLNVNFINTLHQYTELALGGGNPLSHPQLIEFLKICRSKRIIVNMTVNQKHFMDEQKYIQFLIDHKLITSLGVSLTDVTDEFINTIQQYPNIVLHIINGMIKVEDLRKLYDKNIKVLILGYKQFRRGILNYQNDSKNIEMFKTELYNELENAINHLKVVSFDNLAIKQLEVKRLMSQDEWNEFYMGDDGKFTMYIDLVEQKYARSSISEKRYDLLDNIDNMFEIILNE